MTYTPLPAVPWIVAGSATGPGTVANDATGAIGLTPAQNDLGATMGANSVQVPRQGRYKVFCGITVGEYDTTSGHNCQVAYRLNGGAQVLGPACAKANALLTTPYVRATLDLNAGDTLSFEFNAGAGQPVAANFGGTFDVEFVPTFNYPS